jgi:hypothetical protein
MSGMVKDRERETVEIDTQQILSNWGMTIREKAKQNGLNL